jgi:hypothetical protein
MKKLVMVLVLLASMRGLNFAQQNSTNLYTFFVNIVNEQFRFPLIGLVNIAEGSHSLPQVGFINWNQNDFETVQVGFINTVGGDMTGAQVGFINTAAGSVDGLQIGFINYADSIETGIPIGFLSIVRDGGYKAIELSASEISPFNANKGLGIARTAQKW